MDYHVPSMSMPPFHYPMPIQQYPYTAPLLQGVFPPMQPPMHLGFPPPYSSTASLAPYIQAPPGFNFNKPIPPPPGFTFDKPIVAPLLLASPLSIDDEGVPVAAASIQTIQCNQVIDHCLRKSITDLTLAPLTCPESTIHIVVCENDKSQIFPIHRALLCHYSPYFRSLLKHGPKTIHIEIKKKNVCREWRWEDSGSVDKIMTCADDCNKNVPVDVVVNLPSSCTNEINHREIVLDTEALGDVGRIVFAAFVNWLYHGYEGFGLVQPLDQHPNFDAVTLIQLWVFAGRVGVPELQNACIEGIEWWRMTTNIIQTSMLNWVYEQTDDWDGNHVEPKAVIPTAPSSPPAIQDQKSNDKEELSKTALTPADCPLRTLLIDQCAWKLDGDWLLGMMDGVKNEDQFPRQALVDLVSRMRVILNGGVNPPFANTIARGEAYHIEQDEKEEISMECAIDGKGGETKVEVKGEKDGELQGLGIMD